MNKNILLTLMLGLFLISFSSASLGCYKLNENINIITNLNTSSVTLDILSSPSPSSEILITNTPMTKSGNAFNYSFNPSKLGVYTYGYSDAEGNSYSNDFEVTTNGKCGTNANIVLFLILIIIIYGITCVGFFVVRNIPITILGGMAMMAFGIYMFNEGIIIFRDWITTYLSYITIGLGIIVTAFAIFEWITD